MMARIGSWSALVLIAMLTVLAVGCGGKATQPEDQPDKMTGPEMAEGNMTEVEPPAVGPDEVAPADDGMDPAIEPDPVPEDVTEPEPMTEPDPDVVDAPVDDMDAPVDGMDARIEELKAEKSLQQQAREFVALKALETARRFFEQGQLPKALEHARKALDMSPANQEAQKLNYEILRSMGRRPGEFGSLQEQIRQEREVKRKESMAKAQLQFDRGHEAFMQDDFDSAAECFENVLAVINYSPFPADWGDLRAEAEDYLAQAKEKQALRAEAERRDEAKKAFAEARVEELRRIQEQQAKIADILESAYERFDNGEYAESEALADEILKVDARNSFAQRLKGAAQRGRHDKEATALIKEEKTRYKEWLNDILETRIPYTGIVNFPNQEYWNRISRLRAEHGSSSMRIEASTEEIALANRLEEEVVGFDFTDTPFTAVVDFIHNVRNINIVVDERIKGDVDAVTVTLKVNDLSVKNVLDLLLAYGGDLTYVLRDNLVFITRPEFARGQLKLKVHPVGDLTMRITQFIAPNLILKPAGSEFDEDQPQFGKATEGEAAFTGPDELVELIRTNVGGADSWDQDGVSINPYGSTIVVTHSAQIQNEVASFLDDLRRFSGLVVTIESRFLTVSKNFLRDVGVDIAGLGGQKGPMALLDDVTAGLEDNSSAGYGNAGGAVNPASSKPASGAFFNDGRHGDMRSLSENILDNALGNVLSSMGGATFQYTYLDDVNLSVILRMVEKHRNARVMNAPSLTVFNTQRANITLVNQLSFIQDFDVEVAQTAFIADPIVGIVQDGLTLDVRPTVSNDRRYVTLELQPTVATLLRPIPTFTTSLGAFTTPVTIQIPEITIQKSQTTVRVPDGGTVMIGGLKNISVVDRRAMTPWLSKIPLLGFFFKREGNSEEVEHLMIIITAKITDLRAEETLRVR
jgi:type II secretory pathway component GspD/PulD (secretin)